MSKLAIVLCAVVFASATNTSILSGALQTFQHRVQSEINNEISKINLKLTITKEEINKEMEAVLRAKIAFSNSTLEEIKKVGNHLSATILRTPKSVDTSKCTQLFNDLYHTAKAIISNINDCVYDKLELKLRFIQGIDIASKMLHELTEIREEIKHCGDNVPSSKFMDAMYCVNARKTRAMIVSERAVKALDSNIAQLYQSLRLDTILATCQTTNKYHYVQQKLQETKFCIFKATQNPPEHKIY